MFYHCIETSLTLSDTFSNAAGYNLSREIDDLLHESSSIPPKFIFKSLRRNNFKEDTVVTLLEENEIIGHGTTGT